MANRTSGSRVSSLPSGTLTFLFTDIEGSTRLVTALGDAFGSVLARHHALIRAAIETSGGIEVSTEGDAFFVVFQSAPAALIAAASAQRSLGTEPWPSDAGTVRVRMGVHTGEATIGGDNYVGLEVHRAARIAGAAHGGQVLVSATTGALAGGSLPAGLELRELGEFRLKDLDRPERLAQLVGPGLEAEFPPPRTLDIPSNLPPQVTSFIGRNREIGEVADVVRRSRLVTLTGPGGTGKTRLSLRVAERLSADYPGGAFFVDLSTLTDPALIPTTIAQAIGLREDSKRPVIETLELHLRDLRMLLLLDNFEQLLDGAPLVGSLLQAAPNLTVLATSREVLHLRGEQEYPLSTLEVPDLRTTASRGDLTGYDAIALFVERARAVRPDFELTDANTPSVAAICARLDGLPLAIELAAARIKVFTPEAILARLETSLSLLSSGARDVPERQRTLRGAIDWSYDLLDSTERALLRRIAIFVGGCSIESAAAVCDPNVELGVDMLDALVSFVDKSLLRQVAAEAGEPRFQMLETIREYGLWRLADSDDAEPTRFQHEDHFAALARDAEPELLGTHQKAWLDRLEVERDNLRAAMQRAIDDGRIELALAMGGALWRFWQQRGHLAEGRESLVALLGHPAAAGRTAARASALAGLAGVSYWQGDFAAAGQAYAEALDIERGLDDPGRLAEALYNSWYVAQLTGDQAAAGPYYDEAARIYEKLGDTRGAIKLREALVFSMLRNGEFSAARAIQEENLDAFRQAEEPFRIANGLMLLSAINLRDGALAAAHRSLGEAIGIFRGAGDTYAIVRALTIAAVLANTEDNPTLAARLSGATALLKEPLGDVATPLQILRLEDPAQVARLRLGDAPFDEAFRAGRALSLDEMVALVQGGSARP